MDHRTPVGRLVAALTVVAIATTLAPAAAAAPGAGDRVVTAAVRDGLPATHPDLLHVELSPGADLPDVLPGVARVEAAFPGSGGTLGRWRTVTTLPGTVEAVATRLRALPVVATVERAPVRVPAYEPNDPRRRDQWHLDRIAAAGAWNVDRGSRAVRLGVIDTQFDRGHGELRGVLQRRDGSPGVDVYDAGCRSDVPYAEHGTLVTGVAAATTDNATGVASVGFTITVVAAQTGIELAGSCAISPHWTRALKDQADAGVPVVNLSFASPRSSRLEADAVRYATNRGTLVVAAAGNDGSTTPNYPAADPLVLAVAATDAQDRLWDRSSRGDWVDLAAPGVSLLTLCPGGYCYATGTSIAAPVTAATAALLWSSDRSLRGLQLRHRVLDAATEITGRAIDPQLGHGRLRADRTLTQRAVRLYGRDRITTAAAIGREARPVVASGAVDRVVLVPADAPGEAGWTVTLPAAGLLADGRTAVVMTTRAGLHPTARAELDRLVGGGGEVVLPGGPGTGVSPAVEQELVDRGHRVRRLAGRDAAGTAAALADAIVADSGARAALVARGDTFADALSLSGPAAAKGLPLVFVGTDHVPAATCDWLRLHPRVRTLHLAGGTRAISTGVEQQLRGCAGLAGLTITRDAGRSRVETAVAIARRHFGNAPATVAVANGFSWPDAVTGGVLAASHGAPVLTTGGSGALEPAVASYLARGRTRTAFVLGGPVVVGERVRADVQAALGRP